jgi:hypothetical protein
LKEVVVDERKQELFTSVILIVVLGFMEAILPSETA